ncbi:MAG TPA: hypothetical protein VGV68_11750 [Terriglobia bacterium]|nr:hypothetical protein [Terriglobia bacterium]
MGGDTNFCRAGVLTDALTQHRGWGPVPRYPSINHSKSKEATVPLMGTVASG